MIQYDDRETITRFFHGQLSSIPEQIDERMRADTLLKRSSLKGGKVQNAASLQEHILKKRDAKAEEKVVAKRERKVIDFLMENEKKISGKTNCLQA